MFRLRSLFWKIFVAFWLASLFVFFATTFSALRITESRHALERHEDAVLRAADRITFAYENSTSPNMHSGFGRHRDQHSDRHHRRLANILIYDANGKLIHGDPTRHRNHQAHIEFEFNSDTGKLYRVESDRPPRPRFVQRWLAHMRSVSFVFILLASTLVSLGLSWLISRPLKGLGEHARQLAGGNFSSPLEQKLLRRGDEIGDLAKEFNSMAHQLGAMIESRQQLLRDVSHELRAPLARLQAAAALSQQRGASLDAATLQRVEQECERMDQLIQQILDYARMEQEPVLNDCIDLNTLLTELIEDVRLEYATHRIEWHRPSEKVTLQGNTDLLLRALENVVRNACKHTPEGTAVEVSLSSSAKVIEISVRDHGPGIEAQDLPQLFQPFYRGGNSMHGDGFGLGLSIAARAIEKHGGRIKTENHRTGGFQVTISFAVD